MRGGVRKSDRAAASLSSGRRSNAIASIHVVSGRKAPPVKSATAKVRLLLSAFSPGAGRPKFLSAPPLAADRGGLRGSGEVLTDVLRFAAARSP